MATVREIIQDTPRPAGYVLRAPLPEILAGLSASTARSTRTSTDGLLVRIAGRRDRRRLRGRQDTAARGGAERRGAGGGLDRGGERRAGRLRFCMRKSDTTGQLRLLLVDPAARGMGIGARLSRSASPSRAGPVLELVLWTNDILVAPAASMSTPDSGSKREQPHRSFGTT